MCDEVNKQSEKLPPSRTGGLSAIKTILRSDSRVLRDVTAGKSLRVALLQEGDGDGRGKVE